LPKKGAQKIKCKYDREPHPLSQKSESAIRVADKMDGRVWITDELDNPCRSKFGRDRDRIVFCRSYRRLIHKMQLYLPEHDDHRRTRLTHTLEVVQIARAISKNLGMNEELVEAIAFGHDVGHAPFGHAGERQIDSLLKGEPLPSQLAKRMVLPLDTKEVDPDFAGDFRHNYQSVRVLTFLEKYHPDYEGLNLTIQTLEGILKHTNIAPFITRPARSVCIFPGVDGGAFDLLDLEKAYSVTVEGQIVALADDIAQIVHDLDDALRKDVIQFKNIDRTLSKVFQEDVMRNLKGKIEKRDSRIARHCRIAQMRAALLSRFIFKAIESFEEAIRRVVTSRNYYKENGNIKLKQPLLKKGTSDLYTVELDDDVYRKLRELRNDIVLKQHDVTRMDSKGQYLIELVAKPLMGTNRAKSRTI